MPCAGYRKLCERSREVHMLHSITEVLFWDLEAYIPPKAVPYRADQLSYLKAKAHMLLIEPCVDDWLKESEDFGFSVDSQEASNIREWRRAHGRATKLPLSLVERFEKVRTIARDAWVQARIESKFVHFKPHFEEIVELTRKKADLWGYEESPYDALIEDYEPGTKASQFMVVFEELRIALVGLLGKLTTDPISEQYLDGHYPVVGQQTLSREVAAAFGYDFGAGRIDTTTHPFQISLGPSDTRITTRYNEKRFAVSLYGALHEMGPLYEQGLNKELFGLPVGQAVSLGIHELQSRLWENHVGRSLPFWCFWHAAAKTSPGSRPLFSK